MKVKEHTSLAAAPASSTHLNSRWPINYYRSHADCTLRILYLHIQLWRANKGPFVFRAYPGLETYNEMGFRPKKTPVYEWHTLDLKLSNPPWQEFKQTRFRSPRLSTGMVFKNLSFPIKLFLRTDTWDGLCKKKKKSVVFFSKWHHDTVCLELSLPAYNSRRPEPLGSRTWTQDSRGLWGPGIIFM